MRAHVSEHMLNMCAGPSHLCVKEKVNFRLIRQGVADEQAFSAADSAKSQESKKNAVKCGQGVSLIFLPICAVQMLNFWGPRSALK